MHNNIFEYQQKIRQQILNTYQPQSLETLLTTPQNEVEKSDNFSDEDELESILSFLEKGESEDIMKSEGYDDVEAFEKGVVNKIHKYIQKVGNKYFYTKEREVKPINEHRDYLRDKTGLDKLKLSLDGAAHSEAIRDAFKIYYNKKADFKIKHGHDHDSDYAVDAKKLTMHAMHNHINNKVLEIEAKQKNNV